MVTELIALFAIVFRLAEGIVKPPIQWTPRALPRSNWNVPATSMRAKVKNEWSFIYTSRYVSVAR
jgi:hypothetical protein